MEKKSSKSDQQKIFCSNFYAFFLHASDDFEKIRRKKISKKKCQEKIIRKKYIGCLTGDLGGLNRIIAF